ncbi:hypothetical protein PICST_37566 [Scheffersomyces stipitis CBS 6054]|uniref:Uncharacterized protein n=1 Tax=Scheffersomyces stipitis (strain ATCC 58785 / CBS 6054 / NBRC 10063 / NRRL Y-11545) TaxID=322104 RepID=A3GEY8_PICST|nr:predicted protein [Scheffersomyces stipitis CBS 6054]EAZ63666.2 hypothetical protein PICST_37566 [Scheffersomyces stipitis CBS 6054]KAG2731494.1 hypothetical protein G9P44_005081 [Scheffersomyces stipitis]
MDSIFVSARASLLELQDEREIVIRNCRDITAYSKKIIFSGQRIKAVPIRSGNYKEIKTNFSIIALRLAQVNESYIASAQKGSLRGTIASACEELIEALTFIYYVGNKKLLSYEKMVEIIKGMIRANTGNNIDELILDKALKACVYDDEQELEEVEVDVELAIIDRPDYFMGLFDLTGEIMRFTITNLQDYRSELDSGFTFENYTFMKALYAEVCSFLNKYPKLSVYKGEWSNRHDPKGASVLRKKLEVFKQSLSKVEKSLFQVLVRGKEEVSLQDIN